MALPETSKCSIGNDGKVRCPVFSEPRKIYTSSDVNIRKRMGKSVAFVARNKDPEAATEKAIDGIGGMCNYVKPSDLVGIKINITGGISTNPASYTSPAVTKKVVSMVRKCGGNPVVFDSSMIWTDMKTIADKEGWPAWAEENGVEVADLHNLPVVPFNFGDDGVMNVDKASRLVKDLDVLVNIPKLKSHMLTTISVGLKNNYGLLPRADKGIYHAKGIDSVIAETNKAFPTTLVVIDGMNAGEGEAGPLTPDEIPDFNTVIASNDVVCGDAIAAKFMGYDNPMKIRHVREATAMGVGDGKCIEKTNVQENIKPVFGTHPKDGNFQKPDARVIENLSDFTKTVAANPGGAAFMSSFSDTFLGNLSYFGTGFMKLMLKGTTKPSRRYIGKDVYTYNPHAVNLHPEDAMDAALY